ncbi:MAG: hypothetical protein ACI4J1_02400 [Ruminiclostridium sp.]
MAEFDVNELIGDFYQGHANNDADQMKEALEKLQNMIFTGSITSQPFMDYFNEVFSGRTAYNTLLTVNDYPKESIIRELFQNIFGCHYKTKDIKIVVSFMGKGQVKIAYNEVGFSMEQILFYLSFGRNDGDRTREGRFGVGAKSVFMNTEWFSLRSNNFSFHIVNNDGSLTITEFDLFGAQFNGTEIIFKVSDEDYERILHNFKTITEERGDYINMVELCFAFNRKKAMDITESDLETHDRTFNIAVMENNQLFTVYKVIKNQKQPTDIPTIRFMQNGKSVIDFICYEDKGFVYLIPFAVANAKRDAICKLLLDKYNYFSTYELTGFMKSEGEKFVQEKLSAFFISVPNDYITMHRTGIRYDAEETITKKISQDLLAMISKYKQYFVLELHQIPNGTTYFMHPKSYAFEFFKNFINTSKLAKDIQLQFQDNISLLLPERTIPIDYAELKKSAYATTKKGVSKEQHLDGSAEKMYITDALEDVHNKLGGKADETIVYVAYEWETEDGSEKGREYLYEFNFNQASYYISSKAAPHITDYNLYYHFSSLISKMLGKFLSSDNEVIDEKALEGAMAMFDSIFGEDYKVHMKYYQFYVQHNEEQYIFGVSKMVINNLNDAINTVRTREARFETHQNFNEIIAMLVNSFTQGKDTLSFLREIKEQGGEITLQLDINKKYRFSAYGRQFMIPSSITNADMLDIIGDISVLIKCGMLNGKSFDFDYSRSRYSFDKNILVKNLMSDTVNEEQIQTVSEKIFVSDLKVDRIALLDSGMKIMKILDLGDPISEEDRKTADKYMILRNDFNKLETADIIEYIITGNHTDNLRKFYSSTEEPNRLIPDQIPYYLKPLPSISADEFKYLCDEYKKIRGNKDDKNYKYYFAKDISAKLFGYGGICCACGYETKVINSFTVKDFEVGLIYNDTEKPLKFGLYLCANDALAAKGWLISDVVIGGESPFKWIESIKENGSLTPADLTCQVKYRPQITYDVGVETSKATVINADEETIDVVLSPLMAAKWFVDNTESE